MHGYDEHGAHSRADAMNGRCGVPELDSVPADAARALMTSAGYAEHLAEGVLELADHDGIWSAGGITAEADPLNPGRYVVTIGRPAEPGAGHLGSADLARLADMRQRSLARLRKMTPEALEELGRQAEARGDDAMAADAEEVLGERMRAEQAEAGA
jgi:hypothetical protein